MLQKATWGTFMKQGVITPITFRSEWRYYMEFGSDLVIGVQ